jgi:ferredoxin
MREGAAVATEAMECVVGCSTCGNICPTGAISFPKLDTIWKLERERQIFRTVKKERSASSIASRRRRSGMKRSPPPPWRRRALGSRSPASSGTKRFLVRLENLIEGEPFDVVGLRLEVPTLKGARQKAPSYMSFEVTSERQEDVRPFVEKVKALTQEAGLVLVSATPIA